jgi:hypothetical protein
MEGVGGTEWAIPLLRLTGVLAWLLVLGRMRNSHQDSRIGATVLLVAVLIFASSALYLGAPLEWSSAMLNLASIAILAMALWVLYRLPQ